MTDGHNWLSPQHSRSAISHNLADFFSIGRCVAMCFTHSTKRFMLHMWTTLHPGLCIGHYVLAFLAKFSFFCVMIAPAIYFDHAFYCLQFIHTFLFNRTIYYIFHHFIILIYYTYLDCLT